METRMQGRRKGVALLLLGAAGLWGCGPDEGIEQFEATEPLTTLEQELPSVGAFNWNQGWAATPMGSTADRVCYLTRMSGRFEGGGESVHAFISGSSWYLAGSSMQVGVSASAYCAYVPSSAYSGEYAWSQGQPYAT